MLCVWCSVMHVQVDVRVCVGVCVCDNGEILMHFKGKNVCCVFGAV